MFSGKGFLMNKIRPIGLSVLCVLLVISKGITPLWLSFIFMQSNQMSQLLGMGIGAFAVNALISLGIILAAFFTWEGSVRAKKYLFMFVWANVLGVAFNNISILIDPSALGIESLDQKQLMQLVANLVRSAFWIVLLYWYFNTAKAKEYFSA
jgi:hypothetical protein